MQSYTHLENNQEEAWVFENFFLTGELNHLRIPSSGQVSHLTRWLSNLALNH
jgi:hypothetical protein